MLTSTDAHPGLQLDPGKATGLETSRGSPSSPDLTETGEGNQAAGQTQPGMLMQTAVKLTMEHHHFVISSHKNWRK